MDYYAHTPASPGGSWHLLPGHLLSTASKAREFADAFACGDIAYIMGLFHDAGKFSDEFQNYLRACYEASLKAAAPPRPGTAEHKAAGSAIVLDKLADNAGAIAALCIMGHHGGLLSPSSAIHTDLSDRRRRVRNFDDVCRVAVTQTRAAVAPVNFSSAGKVVDAAVDPFALEMLGRMLYSCLVDADSLDTEAHNRPERSAVRAGGLELSSIVDDWRRRLAQHVASLAGASDDRPVPRVRRQVLDACLDAARKEPGVFSLATPTGGGKTLSSLAFALEHAKRHAMRRVIYVAPYTTIIDQTASEFRAVLGSDGVLEHHSAVREESGSDDGGDAELARRLAAENWDAPLIVTTTVQFFESLFSHLPSRCRKLHNMARSVVILDEVQTLPAFLLAPLVSGLNALVSDYGATVVLCSATQPALSGESQYLRGFADVRPIVEDPKPHFQALKRVRYRVEREAWDWSRTAAEIRSAKASSLTVLNTKKDALSVLDALKGENVKHLSTLLCGKHRRAVIDDIKAALQVERDAQGPPVYLVSTQVVEAGVNLDFPRVFRAMGPLDRIIQAAGRCNREGNRSVDESLVVIFNPQEGGKPAGMYRIECEEAQKFLEQSLADRDLGDPDVPVDYFARLYATLQAAGLDQRNIQQDRKKLNYPAVGEKFKLISDKTASVFCLYDDDAADLLDDIERGMARGQMVFRAHWRRLQPYLVSVREHEIDVLGRAGKLRPLADKELYLWTAPYDRVCGIGSDVVYDPADLICDRASGGRKGGTS